MHLRSVVSMSLGFSFVLSLVCCPFPAAFAGDDSNAPAKIAGSVRWKDGRQLVDAQITLHRMDEESRLWKPAKSKVVLDADGRFEFNDLSSEHYWCLVARAPESGIAMRLVVLEGGATNQVSVTLKPAVKSWITVRDAQGSPVAGARFRCWEVVDGTAGSFYVGRGAEVGLGFEAAVSDEAGRLPLPDLPEGAVLSRTQVDHSSYAAELLKPDVPLQAGEVAACSMERGFPLRLHFVQPASEQPATDVSGISLRLYHKDTWHSDSILSLPVAVKDGYVEQRIRPGDFRLLDMQTADHVFLPWLYRKQETPLRLAPGELDEFTFRALPKVPVNGRVVDEKGQPIANAMLFGEIQNVAVPGTRVPDDLYPWASTGDATTDKNGEYRVSLASGRGRITFAGDGIPSAAFLDVNIEGNTAPKIPDIVVRKIPTVCGVVYGLDGRPAAKTIVRIFSDTTARWTTPALTNENGEFQIPLTAAPRATKTDSLAFEHQIIAYSPYAAHGGTTKIDLHDYEALGHVKVHMSEQPLEWPLAEMRVAFTPWERGEPDEQIRQERVRPENKAGIAPPELDGVAWLNTDKRSLAEFRGQYVFLDFYTTWCGPCRGDFPTIKLAYDLYRDQGLAVVCVHDNSSSHETIREHAETQKMEMPIVIDQEDGRIINSYKKLGLMRGYPSYLFLDREGRLITADGSIPGPTLRGYKLEVIREIFLRNQSK